MCERLKQAVLKTAIPERVSGVRIPLPPPFQVLAISITSQAIESRPAPPCCERLVSH